MRFHSLEVKVLFAALLLLLLAYGASSAVDPAPQQSNYLEPTITISPHGGYTTASNKCKYCHAVHVAEGAYMLTRADKRAEACDYCHGDGSGAGTIIVGNYEGHTMSKTSVYYGDAPLEGDTDVYSSTPDNPFSCFTCHSVHGNPERTVVLADLSKDYLLVNNPDTTGTTFTSSNTLSEWCADCHATALGSHDQPFTVDGEIFYTHDSSRTSVTTMVIDPDDGVNNGPSCRQCHASSLFPHGQGGTGRDMLKDDFDGISLDDVCNDCHQEDELP